MIDADNLALLLKFLLGFFRIIAIPLGTAIVAVILLRRNKNNR